MRSSHAPLGALFVVVVACGGGAQPRVASDAATAAPQASPSPAAPAPSPVAPRVAVPTPPAEAIGWADVPAAPSAEARVANAAALTRHRAGDFAASRVGFEKAVALAPRFELARYNLACAHARLGALEDAARALEALAAEDLPVVARKLETDPDLAALAAAPPGRRLGGRLAELAVLWEQATRAGVPAIAYRGARSPEGWPRVQLLRAGVWDHGRRRFVPLVPPATLPLSALLDVAHGEAIVVGGQGRFDGIPQVEGAAIQHAPLSPVGTALVTARGGNAFFADAGTRAGTVRYRLNTEGGEPRWSTTSLRPSEPPDGEWISVRPEGTLLHAEPPAGFALRGNDLVLPDSTTLRLGPGHAASQAHQVVVSADGQTAVVVSVRADCPEGEGRLAHFVDRVTLGTRSVERLSTGATTAAVRLGPDGALYLQVGTQTRRYPTPAATTHEALPDGVLLVAPMDVPDCSA